MRDKELYAQILGIGSPWQVEAVDLVLDAGEVHIVVALTPGSPLQCPACEEPCPGYLTRSRRWRHLDTCQYRTIVVADVPRVQCAEHGVRQVVVPWAEPGSRFTALFEALVIDWLKEASWIALGGAPIPLLVGYMNWQLFGNPFTLGFTALYGDAVGLGFHTDPWGEPFTLSVALSNLVVGVRRLHVHLYEWPIPALLPLAVWALFDRHRRPSDLVVALGVIAAPFLYFFYWHSGFFLGPRFFFASVPFLVLGTARAWRWGMSNSRRRSTAFVRLDAATAFAAFAVLVWGWIGILPARIDVYRTGLSSFKLHPERELRAAGVDRALVIIPESWGSRMVTALWAMGAPIGLVEQAYRGVDHCDLDGFVRDMRRAELTGEQVTEQLRLMVAGITAAAPRVAGAPDPTLRLRPRGRLPDRCQIELERDLRGFALYSTVGWRNEIGLSSGIVFARDLYERNGALLDRYPGWAVWRYAPPEDRPNASSVLTQLRGDSLSTPDQQ